MIGPEVMLAHPGNGEAPDQVVAQLTSAGWWFELKFDGIRAVVIGEAGRYRIWSRRQLEMTHRYPDVVAWCEANPFEGVVDGEIVVAGLGGKPDFTGAHLRDAQSSPGRITALAGQYPATFIPFDLPPVGGDDLPYEQRREQLEAMFPPGVVSPANQDGVTLWEFVVANSLEGLVAKRPGSQYRKGRQQAWRKIKLTHRLTALVTGYVAGRGSRGDIGALQLALWDDLARELVSIGNVGSGMSGADLALIKARLQPGQTPLRVEVSYLEVSASRQLRMPVFLGIRDDVPPDDCRTAQFHLPRSAAS